MIKGQLREVAHVQRLVRSEDTILGGTGDNREYFLLAQCEDVELSRGMKVLDIKQVTVSDIAEWRSQGGTRGAALNQDVGGADGFWRQKYQPEFGRFVAPSEEETELRLAGECLLCTRRQEKVEAERLEVSQDGKEVRVKATWYRVGQFIMLTGNTPFFYLETKTSPNKNSYFDEEVERCPS